MASKDSFFWKDAIKMKWELVDIPKGSRPIWCKWVFKNKYLSDDTLNTYKARLVTKRFRQKECVDYFETYAPVERATTIRVLFALASLNKLIGHQMDVKTTLLNGDLNEEI